MDMLFTSNSTSFSGEINKFASPKKSSDSAFCTDFRLDIPQSHISRKIHCCFIMVMCSVVVRLHTSLAKSLLHHPVERLEQITLCFWKGDKILDNHNLISSTLLLTAVPASLYTPLAY